MISPQPVYSFVVGGFVILPRQYSMIHIVSARAIGRSSPCALPFTYKGNLYWGCTTHDHDQYWCYDSERKWGNCVLGEITIHVCMHTYIHTYIFIIVNFDALAQASDFRIERRRVVFLCWMLDSKLGSLKHQFTSRVNVHSQTDWAIEEQAENSNSTARHLTSLPIGRFSHLALATYTYMLVVVNFDALTQASDFRIERRPVVFLCWMQDSNPGSQTPNRPQSECPLTNRLSYRGSS